ncbi:hypothetical protein GmRootV118_39630 [Variovorax sp. V118]|uniref:SMI1/KNR4 family protein n=1 Tax=Variovorax sp. V118 TaxID=3065954 RepID=UPI0034E8CE8D
MKVLFPNPFGRAPASAQAVDALQRRLGFSDAYAAFLRTQNGFSLYEMEQAGDIAAYVRPDGTASSASHANFRVLNSFGASDPHCDLETLQAESLLAAWFLDIGSDPAGNPFVEVLHGRHKGRIASLDHDLFAGKLDTQEFLADMELTHLPSLSLDAQADALCDEAQGLVWFHASDMQSFLDHCIHCDDDFWGFVVDERAP